jgi:hypothetical protein
MLAGMTDSTWEEPPISIEQTAGLPVSIAADLVEAARCCSFGAYRAAGLLTRRAFDQAAVMRRVPLEARTLHQRLGWLLEHGDLPRTLGRDARTIRDVGTAAAHGAEPLARSDAYAVVMSALAVVTALCDRNC